MRVAAPADVRNDGRAPNRTMGHDIVSGTAQEGARQEEIKGKEEMDGERNGETAKKRNKGKPLVRA